MNMLKKIGNVENLGILISTLLLSVLIAFLTVDYPLIKKSYTETIASKSGRIDIFITGLAPEAKPVSLKVESHEKTVQAKEYKWLKNRYGQGVMLSLTLSPGKATTHAFTITSTETCTVDMSLTGHWRRENGEMIPLFMRYSDLEVNGKPVSIARSYVWHNLRSAQPLELRKGEPLSVRIAAQGAYPLYTHAFSAVLIFLLSLGVVLGLRKAGYWASERWQAGVPFVSFQRPSLLAVARALGILTIALLPFTTAGINTVSVLCTLVGAVALALEPHRLHELKKPFVFFLGAQGDRMKM